MAEVLELRLAEFLGTLARRRFDWEQCNCFTICADWILAATGRDPAEKWRHVKSKVAARRVVRDAGGDIAFAIAAMRFIGAARTSDPQAGDVALVRTPSGKVGSKVAQRVVGAICVDGKNFAVLTVDVGLVIAPLPVICAWKVAHGRAKKASEERTI